MIRQIWTCGSTRETWIEVRVTNECIRKRGRSVMGFSVSTLQFDRDPRIEYQDTMYFMTEGEAKVELNKRVSVLNGLGKIGVYGETAMAARQKVWAVG